MCVYLRSKFEVSRIILTGFRQGLVLNPPPHTPASKQTPEKPTQIRVKWLALKAFITKELKNASAIAIVFVFLHKMLFLLAHVYLKCNLKSKQFIVL